MSSRFLGGVFIVTGTTTGAGMLALPIVSAHLGFFLSSLLLFIFWGIAIYSALVNIDVILRYREPVTIPFLAGVRLGKFAKIFSSLMLAILLYSLLSAYINGVSSIIEKLIGRINYQVIAFFCTLVPAMIICCDIKFVDLWNRLLLSLKLLLFILVIIIFAPHVKGAQLLETHNYQNLSKVFLIFFTAFGFHGSIPAVIKYVGSDRKEIRRVFIIGSLIPLAAYILWQFVTLGTLPYQGENSFLHVNNLDNDVGVFVTDLAMIIKSNYLAKCTKLFSLVTLFTSIICVSISLHDYIMEIFQHDSNKLFSKIKSSFLTFALPLFFALFYHNGFIFALGYAAAALALLAIVIPSFIALKNKSTQKFPLYVLILIGLTLTVLQIII